MPKCQLCEILKGVEGGGEEEEEGRGRGREGVSRMAKSWRGDREGEIGRERKGGIEREREGGIEREKEREG